jgi:uncharacterized delta-60 repeat protein
MKILSKAMLLGAAAMSLCASHAFAAPGDLDGAFGSGGSAATSVMGFNGEAHAITHDSLGRLVVAGYSYNEDLGTSVMVIARFRSDGTLDTGFGDVGTGFVTTTPPGGLTDATNYSFAIAIDSKDRIVVGGEIGVMDPRGFAVEMFSVARYLPNGLPDASFAGRGLVQTLISPGELDSAATSIAIDSKDRIVAAGYSLGGSTEGGVLVRYNEDGTQDHGFAHTGIVSLNPYGNFIANKVRVDSAGRVVVLGRDIDPTSFMPVSIVARYLDNGEPDATFGNAEPGFSVAADIGANSLLLDAADDVLIGGAANDDFTLTVERFDATGQLDASFGTGGIATAPALLLSSVPSDLQWDGHGNVVVGTTIDATFAAVRFTADGEFDDSFGAFGIASGPTSTTTSYYAGGVTVDDSDHFTLCGWSNDGVNESFVVARFED